MRSLPFLDSSDDGRVRWQENHKKKEKSRRSHTYNFSIFSVSKNVNMEVLLTLLCLTFRWLNMSKQYFLPVNVWSAVWSGQHICWRRLMQRLLCSEWVHSQFSASFCRGVALVLQPTLVGYKEESVAGECGRMNANWVSGRAVNCTDCSKCDAFPVISSLNRDEGRWGDVVGGG